MKRPLAAISAAALAIGIGGWTATAAFAEDTPPAEVVVTDVAPATTPAPVVVETPPASPPTAVEPVVEPVAPTVTPDPEPTVIPQLRSASVSSLVAVAGPNYIETSHVLTTLGVDITLHNVSPWIYPTSVKIDGTHSYGPTVDNRTDTDGNGTKDLNGPQKDASATRVITFPACSGDHTVSYRVDAGSENSLYVGKPVGQWTDLTITAFCDYRTVAWLAPGGAPPNHFDVPQTTPTDGSRTVVTPVPNVHAADALLEAYRVAMACGTEADFQVDAYLNDATTDALVAGGVLNGPNNPTEHLVPGGEGVAWKFVHLTANPCPTPVDPDVPKSKDLCGVGNDHYGLPDDETGITYTRSGLDIIATLGTGYVWGTLPAGYVDNGDGTATYPLSAGTFTDDPCSLNPGPKVDKTDWVDGEYECDDTEVEQTREVTTTTYVWANDQWNVDTATTVTETGVRQLDDDEIKPCPVPTGQLGMTGSDATPGFVLAGSLFAAALIAFLVLAIRRAREANQQ